MYPALPASPVLRGTDWAGGGEGGTGSPDFWVKLPAAHTGSPREGGGLEGGGQARKKSKSLELKWPNTVL